MRALSSALLAHAHPSAFAPVLDDAFAWTPGIGEDRLKVMR